MKQTTNLVRVMACVAALVGSLALVQAGQVGKAVVRSVKGEAMANGAALKVGQALGPGDMVETGSGSAVDLFMDANGPLVRLTENTKLKIEKLSFEATGADTVIETVLDLKSGTIVGIVRKLAATSKYEIKTPTGVAGIRGTEYVISADGSVNVLEGQVVVVFVKADGTVVTQVVNAGEMFNAVTQKVEPIPSDKLSEYRGWISSMVTPAAGVPLVEPPPVQFVSPLTGAPAGSTPAPAPEAR